MYKTSTEQEGGMMQSSNRAETVKELIKSAEEKDEGRFLKTLNAASQEVIDSFVTHRWNVSSRNNQWNGLTHTARYQTGNVWRQLWEKASPSARENALQQNLGIADVIRTGGDQARYGLAIIFYFQPIQSILKIINTTDPIFLCKQCGRDSSIYDCLEGNKNLAANQKYQLELL